LMVVVGFCFVWVLGGGGFVWVCFESAHGVCHEHNGFALMLFMCVHARHTNQQQTWRHAACCMHPRFCTLNTRHAQHSTVPRAHKQKNTKTAHR
jgi:hypothetical protein